MQPYPPSGSSPRTLNTSKPSRATAFKNSFDKNVTVPISAAPTTTDDLPIEQEAKAQATGRNRRACLHQSHLHTVEARALVKENRVRRREEMMKRFAVTDSVRVDGALAELIQTADPLAPPEEKLKLLMIAAKESGMTAKALFEYFDENGDEEISPAEFRAAIKRLDQNRNIFVIADDELASLVAKFDADGDGTISMREFRHFCYNIPALAWKAERVRLQATGEYVSFGARSNSEMSPHPTICITRRDAAVPSSLSNHPEEGVRKLHESEKFFWRTREKLTIAIFLCSSLNVLVLRAFDEAKDHAHDMLYVDSTKVKIDDRAVEDEAKNRQATRFDDAKRPLAEVVTGVKDEDLAKWVLQRVTLEQGKFGIMRLFDDNDGEYVFETDPGCGKFIPQVQRRQSIDAAGAFQSGLLSLQKQSNEVKVSTSSARRMSRRLTGAMETLRSLGKDLGGRTTRPMGPTHNKYVRAMLCGIHKQQVQQMQDLLDRSDFYQSLAKKQEKQAEERRAVPIA